MRFFSFLTSSSTEISTTPAGESSAFSPSTKNPQKSPRQRLGNRQFSSPRQTSSQRRPRHTSHAPSSSRPYRRQSPRPPRPSPHSRCARTRRAQADPLQRACLHSRGIFSSCICFSAPQRICEAGRTRRGCARAYFLLSAAGSVQRRRQPAGPFNTHVKAPLLP